MAKPKILILTIPAGGGHDATAQVMADALRAKFGHKYKIEVTNVLGKIGGFMPLDKMAADGYANSVKILKAYPYKLFINFLNSTPKLMNEFFSSMLRVGMTKLLRKEQPVLLISTFPVLSYAACRIIRAEGWDMPVVSIITDAGEVLKLWLMGVEDALFVATSDTKAVAIRQGVPADRIYDLGFPIKPVFQHLPSKSAARAQLELQDKPTVLLTSGGLGLSPVKFVRLAKLLAKADLDAQLLFVCGKNKSLKQQLMDINYRPYTQIFGFAENMPILMAASDFIVGKAGWITLYESMVARRPSIIMDVIPGQEEPNAEFVSSRGVGLVITDPRRVAEQIERFVTNPTTLEPFEQALAKLAISGDAADRIADQVAARFLAGS